MKYKQCILRKGMKIQTAWIPEEFAVQNKMLDIKGDPSWVAISASTESISYEEANKLSQDHKTTRKASDI